MTSKLDWVRKLDQKLEDGRPAMERFDQHYEDEAPMSFLSDEVKKAVGNRLKTLRINWSRLVVDALIERVEVQGFRLAPGEEASSDLWDIWERNNLSEASSQLHLDALVHGRAYLLVWGTDEGIPTITAESGLQTFVQTDPGTGERLRAIKRWKDLDDEFFHAFLYEPNEITRWKSKGTVSGQHGEWSKVDTIPNPLGAVNVIPVVNRPRLMRPLGTSELADIVEPVEAISKLCTDLMTSSEFSAAQRRWATGVEIVEEPVLDDQGNPVLDEDGNPQTKPTTQFSNTAGRVWISESEESKFGQFNESDLRGFIEAIKLLTNAVASLAGLPPHFVALSATDNPASAEAIRSAEQSLVQKAKRRMQAWSGAYEEAMRLALLVRDGSIPGEAQRLETIWANPESRSPAVIADAATKLVQAGIIPAEQAQVDVGYSPQEREAMREMTRRAAVDRAVLDLERVAS